MKKNKFAIVFILSLLFSLAHAQSFKPGELWTDNEGIHINAHGGGVLYYKGFYYWYGEHKNETGASLDGISCYSSKNLYEWKREGIALSVSNDSSSLIVKGCTMERPKVVYNKQTNQFVMWFHLELKDQGYKAALSGVAISNSPRGPFHFIEAQRANASKWASNFSKSLQQLTLSEPEFMLLKGDERRNAIKEGYFIRRDFKGGQMARDMTVFVDNDQKAYHIFASEENQTLHICELSEDYLSHSGRYIRIAAGAANEAPALFFDGEYYWMFASGCTGWKPNQARLLRSKSIMGNWEYVGDPCRLSKEENARLTFHSQSTFILPIEGKKNSFIFMADRWNGKNLMDSRYIWLPVLFDKDGIPYLEWKKEWTY